MLERQNYFHYVEFLTVSMSMFGTLAFERDSSPKIVISPIFYFYLLFFNPCNQSVVFALHPVYHVLLVWQVPATCKLTCHTYKN